MPTTYNLRTDRDIIPLPSLPVAPTVNGAPFVDPTFGAKIWRVTDEILRSDRRSWGTPSGPNLSAWSADGTRFYVVGDDGSTVQLMSYKDGAILKGDELFFITEPCFARVAAKSHILYSPHYGYTVTAFDITTKARRTLFDVQNDVGLLSQDASVDHPNGSYMSACYASAGTPERVAVMYGDIQETHRYMTILDVDNPARRVTINTRTSQMKIDGGTWTPLLRAGGLPALINFGLHSISIDRSGKWVKLDISGNQGGAAHTAFFNVETRRIHEWTSNAWYGHYSLGYEHHVCCIADPAGGAMYQWLLTDLRKSGLPPQWEKRVDPPMQGDHRLADHSSWNNAKPASLEPIVSGTGRAATNTNWGTWYEELVAVATTGPSIVWRIAHHRMAVTDASGADISTFRDSPRPQVSPDGMWALFTSNWGLSLGTYGPAPKNHRRDVFLVRLERQDVAPAGESLTFYAQSIAPTSVVDGDIWYDGTGFKRLSGGKWITLTINVK